MMNEIKAILISVNDGFKVEKEVVINTEKLPKNVFSNCNAVDGKKVCDHDYECTWNCQYFWIASLVFPDDIVIDYQTRGGLKQGHPDFIVYNKNDPSEKKYVEFKSQTDALSVCQMKWMAKAKNSNKKKYILIIEDYFGGLT